MRCTFLPLTPTDNMLQCSESLPIGVIDASGHVSVSERHHRSATPAPAFLPIAWEDDEDEDDEDFLDDDDDLDLGDEEDDDFLDDDDDEELEEPEGDLLEDE